jgi:hypothetical protein
MGMWALVIALMLGQASGQTTTGILATEKLHCVTRPAGDGCNTCTECGDGTATACTLAYCGRGQTALKQPQFYGTPGDLCTSDAMFNQPQIDLGPDCYARWLDKVGPRTRLYLAMMPLVEPLPPECPDGCSEWHPTDGMTVCIKF